MVRITADETKIKWIGKIIFTRVGGVKAIAKFGGGGCCRQLGAMTDTSPEAWWLSERSAAMGVFQFSDCTCLVVGCVYDQNKIYVYPSLGVLYPGGAGGGKRCWRKFCGSKINRG